MIACLAAAGAHADDLLTIYHEAQAGDPVYAAARAAHEAQIEALPQGRAGLLPSVTLSADTQINDRDVAFRPPGFPGFPATSSQRYNSNDFGVTLTQPLFRYRNWVSFEQAKSQVGQADAQLALAAQDLIVRVAQAYFDVLLAQDDVVLAAAQKTAIGEQLEQAKRNFEVGTATITDNDDAQARFDLNAAQAIDAQNNFDIKREALQQLIGRMPDALAPIGADVALDRPQPDDINAWIARAQDTSLQVQAARAAVEIADREIAKHRAGHLPTLDAVAAYTDAAQGAGPFGGAGLDTRNKYLGLQLSLPLFEGGRVSSEVRQAAAGLDQARQELENARRSAAFNARQAFLGVINGIAQVKALRVALSSSRTSLDSTKLGREVGVRTQVDVLNVQQQVAGTQRDLARATYNYVLNVLKLKAAAGTLTEDDLAHVNQWLQK